MVDRDNRIMPLASLVGIVVVIFGFVYQVMENPKLQGCSLFGESSRLTVSIIVLVAVSGWIVAFYQIGPRLIDGYLRPTLVGRTEATDADLLRALRSSETLDIFGSSSERLRSFLHSNVRNLPRGLKIRVLLRDDETPARHVKLVDQAEKWKTEIGPRVASVQLVTYRFDPLMFRGVVIDGERAILGWYYRGRPLRQGEDLDWFWVYHVETVHSVLAAFEDMFVRGSRL